ncbi:MAG: hypothetical protein DWQ02_26975 [Bacteroidetes bacterium]|nr:MAG: hypothetical protein DWQ02_26975 [Bacteroidota bacterium]
MNLNFRYSTLGVLLIVLIISACKTTGGLSTKEALLRFQPTKGDQYKMGMQMSMMMEGPQAMTMTMTMDNDLKVNGVDKDGSFYLDNILKKIGMSMNNPMMNMNYDSSNPNMDDPTSAEMHKTMGAMIDKSMVSKLSNRGELLEAPNYDEIFGDNPEMAGQIDQMNQSLESTFITYPENAVKVGDSWDATSEIAGQVPMTQNFTYTVKEITATNVILSVNGTIDLSPEAMMSGKGDFNGEMTINRLDGMVQLSTMKQNLNMSVMGMDMKTSTDINLTMTKQGK